MKSGIQITGTITGSGRVYTRDEITRRCVKRMCIFSKMPNNAIIRFSEKISPEFIFDLIACHKENKIYAPWLAPINWEINTLDTGEKISGLFTKYLDKSGYIIPTSGSTGNPKLVLGSWEALFDYLDEYKKIFKNDVSLNFSALTLPVFDPFLREIFTPIIAGHNLCIPDDRDILKDPALLAEWIHANNINVLHLVPTIARILFETKIKMSSVKYIMFAGELLYWKDIVLARNTFGEETTIYNLYGPTETTLSKLYYRVSPEDGIGGKLTAPVPVGKAMGVAKTIILSSGKPCAPFEHGEILIRHPYPSHGYLEISDNKINVSSPFKMNPFNSEDKVPVYYTGDIGYIDNENNIVCLGRKDATVKVRGVKVSLSKIEGMSLHVEGVQLAAAKIFLDASNIAKITLFYTGDADVSFVKTSLTKVLLDIEVPNRIVKIDCFPRTPGGKISRADLRLAPDKDFNKGSGNFSTVKNVYDRVLGTIDSTEDPSFFRSGGQSIDAAQIVAEINNLYQTNLRLNDFFILDTVINVTNWLDNKIIEQHGSKVESVVSEDIPKTIPMLDSQIRFRDVIEHHYKNNDRRFQFAWCCQIEGDLNVAKLLDCISVTVCDSWALNVRFDFITNQQIQFDSHYDVDFVELPGAFGDRNMLENIHIYKLINNLFDLVRERPIRFALVRVDLIRYVLIMVNHILASDGTTKTNILRKISTLYNKQEKQTCNFVKYARTTNTKNKEEQSLGFWRKYLEGCEIRHQFINAALQRNAKTFELSFDISTDRAIKLHAFCTRNHISVASYFLRCLSNVIYNNKEAVGDLILISNSRRSSSFDFDVIGCLTDSLIYRANNHYSYLDTHRELMECIENSSVSFLRVTKNVFQDVDVGAPEIFPVIFAPQPIFEDHFSLIGCKATPMYLEEKRWIWPFELYPRISKEKISVDINCAEHPEMIKIASQLKEEIQKTIWFI